MKSAGQRPNSWWISQAQTGLLGSSYKGQVLKMTNWDEPTVITPGLEHNVSWPGATSSVMARDAVCPYPAPLTAVVPRLGDLEGLGDLPQVSGPLRPICPLSSVACGVLGILMTAARQKQHSKSFLEDVPRCWF
jgi:hypothetical protein